MEEKNKFKIGNKLTLILGVLITSISLTFLLLFAFTYKGYINNVEIDKFGALADYFNGMVSPFISAISAILIYIAFKQQVEQNEKQKKDLADERNINKADKDFDRYIKLIDDIKIYENQIKINIKHKETGVIKKAKGNKAIKLYIGLLSQPDREKYIVNYSEFRRNFYVHLRNISFILQNINTLKKDYKSYHTILVSKLIFTIPSLISQVNHFIKLDKEITENNSVNQGIGLYKEIKRTKQEFDKISKNENSQEENKK